MHFTNFSPVLLSALAGLVFTYLQLLRRRWKKANPTGVKELPGPKGFPIIGSVPSLPAKHIWLKFHAWAKIHGPIYQVQLGPDKLVIITSPKIASDLLDARQSIYSSRPWFPAIMGGDNRTNMHYLPLMANGADHRRGKLFGKKLMASIPPEKLADICAQRCKALISDLLASPQDFQASLERCTAGISSQIAWANHDTDVALETLRRAHELVVGISPTATENRFPFLRRIPEWVPNSWQPWKVEELRRYHRERDFWLGQRELVRASVQAGTAEYSLTRQDLGIEKSPLSDEEGAYAVGMMALIGGMLVSSPVQSWVLAMCQHPEWQRRGQEEVDAVCGDRMPTVDDIQNLPVVRALIRETFRWRSPVPYGVPHVLEEDDIYEGYRISKGSQVFALEWGLTRDEALYPDPETFRPERWLDASFPTYKEPLTHYPKIKNHSSYGWGRRACFGQDYSEAVHLAMVASILWSCNIEKGIDRKTGLTVEPSDVAYGALAIVVPEKWPVEIKARSERRIRLLSE